MRTQIIELYIYTTHTHIYAAAYKLDAGVLTV